MSVTRKTNIDYSRYIDAKTTATVREAAIAVEAQAKVLTPVDTGTLRSSIKYRMVGADEAEVGTDVEYGVYVEFGTRKQRAQPFMRPAVDFVRRRLATLWRRARGR